MSFRSAFVEPQVTAIFVLRARSNSGRSSSITDFTPFVQRISIAAIPSHFHSLTPAGRRCQF